MHTEPGLMSDFGSQIQGFKYHRTRESFHIARPLTILDIMGSLKGTHSHIIWICVDIG